MHRVVRMSGVKQIHAWNWHLEQFPLCRHPHDIIHINIDCCCSQYDNCQHHMTQFDSKMREFFSTVQPRSLSLDLNTPQSTWTALSLPDYGLLTSLSVEMPTYWFWDEPRAVHWMKMWSDSLLRVLKSTSKRLKSLHISMPTLLGEPAPQEIASLNMRSLTRYSGDPTHYRKWMKPARTPLLDALILHGCDSIADLQGLPESLLTLVIRPDYQDGTSPHRSDILQWFTNCAEDEHWLPRLQSLSIVLTSTWFEFSQKQWDARESLVIACHRRGLRLAFAEEDDTGGGLVHRH